MRLKVHKLVGTLDKSSKESLQHSEPVCGIGWINSDEILSASDDHKLLRWNINNRASSLKASVVSSNSTEYYPTCMHISPKILNASRNASSASILISTTKGKVHLLNTSGRTLKIVDAHKGAVFVCRWSSDALDFVTSGEDGAVKVWSKGGMLRSVLAQNGRSVYAMDWNASATKVVYCVGEDCFIKPIKEQGNTVKWRAHNGVVLCVAWGASSQGGDSTPLIATGGEDCRYRVWDEMGRQIFSSDPYTYPITTLSWNPTAELLAVGSYNALRLCDRAGWSHSLNKPGCGSIYSIAWSACGAQLVAGCADGILLHAHLVERRFIWENLEAVQITQKSVEVRDVTSELSMELLETRDRITKMSLSHGRLVITTTKQCYIYSSKTWNTPAIIELSGAESGSNATGTNSDVVSLIILAEKCLLLAERNSTVLSIYNYEGRSLSQIRVTGRAAAVSTASTGDDEVLGSQHVALSNEVLIVRDVLHNRVLRFFDISTGNAFGDRSLVHKCDISKVVVNQCGAIAERRVAFLDSHGDAFLTHVNSYSTVQCAEKIGSAISDIVFNNTTNQLAGFQAGQLVVWTLPNVAFIDRKLLPATIINCGGEENLGKSTSISSFVRNTLTIRRSDGSVLAFYVPPYIAGVLKCARSSKWDRAVRICNTVKEKYLWATLAGVAASERNYAIAEICYGQLAETEKVLYLNEIRTETNTQARAALMALFVGRVADADSALVQGAQIFRAIMMNLALFNFDRALELAVKHNIHVDTVLGYRQRYLEQTGQRETDEKYLRHLSTLEIDWPHICEKVRKDRAKYEA